MHGRLNVKKEGIWFNELSLCEIVDIAVRLIRPKFSRCNHTPYSCDRVRHHTFAYVIALFFVALS